MIPPRAFPAQITASLLWLQHFIGLFIVSQITRYTICVANWTFGGCKMMKFKLFWLYFEISLTECKMGIYLVCTCSLTGVYASGYVPTLWVLLSLCGRLLQNLLVCCTMHGSITIATTLTPCWLLLMSFGFGV